MKKFFTLILILLVVGCSNSKKDTTCNDSSLYGYIYVCLPEIDGMKECRNNPSVQAIIKPFLQTGPVLGYYINDETYKKVDQLADITYEDYFMIYGDYNRENYKATVNDLDIIQAQLEQSLFVGTNWDQVNSTIEERYGELSAGQPAFLGKYSSHPNVRTMIILMKYASAQGETKVISAVNCILVKERLVNMAYYLAYRDGASIEQIKAKNDLAVSKFIDANK